MLQQSEKQMAALCSTKLKQIEGTLARVRQLPVSVQIHYLYRWSETVSAVSELSAKAESPIEHIFGVYLLEVPELIADMRNGWYCEVWPQKEIAIGGKTYRADFMVWLVRPTLEETAQNIIVECDGHDYHERTKQQARNDKSRDRALQTAGYHVLHFTGSEIWENPSECVSQVMKYLSTLMERTPTNR